MLIDQLICRVSAQSIIGSWRYNHLSELLRLLLPLRAILVFFDCAKQEVDLGDDDSGERVGPGGAARTGTRACTEGAMMGTVD